jgi:Zn-dependent protease/uncharacterized OB-fold protein
MLDLTLDPAPGTCERCGTQFPPAALACPSCGALVHRARLKRLADVAAAAMASGDRAAALPHWQEALGLVPAGSEQHRIIGSRITELAEAVHAERPVANRPAADGEGGRAWWKHAAGAAVGIVLLLGTKLKFLLLGLTKLSTFASMFGFIAVYWSIHGWPLAVGLAGSIYIHEMGHVAMLRRLGIQAGAPLFIPGVGALVMLKERVVDPIVDARIGLAGPVWGLGAAVAAWLMFLATGAEIWRAIAELTGFLNLFNLMPIWQLDGARGFHALSRQERWGVTATVGIVLWLTGVRVLWLVGAVAIYRTIKDPGGPGHPATLYTFLVLVGALSWFARAVP